MIKFNKNSIAIAVVASLTLGLMGPLAAFAATAPSLGTANSYGVAANVFTNSNTAPETIINGSECATTQPTTVPLAISGSTVTPCAPQVGLDQTAALNGAGGLNTQACTPISGNLDAVIIGSNPPGTFPPGCYAETGAMNITLSANVTLDLTAPGGTGSVWIFTSTGALNTGNNSSITLAHSADPNNVFWAPVGLATIGAYTTGGIPPAAPTFVGNILDVAGITLGHFANLQGRALAFGGTVTTDANTISVPGAPTVATLHVIKLVVNGNSGSALPGNFNIHVTSGGSDVAGSPLAGVSAPGTPYSLTPGTYKISEDPNAAYTQSFSGSCDSTGNITLASGDNLTCTIINTAVQVIPSAGISTGGGRIVPLIGMTKVPTPFALPGGAGTTTYNYTVWNVGGQQALDNISVADNACAPVTYVSGDTNGNGKLDPHENWIYSCATTLSHTTTNTAVVTGYSDDVFHQPAIATAVATVVVGAPLTPPLINVVKVPSRLTPFPLGGGSVTYTYTVTNPGVVPMSNVTLIDNKCSAVSAPSGDTNGNKMLDPGEIWTYTCQTYVPVSTMNTATVEGTANGFTAIGYAFATVLVATATSTVPGLPNTGFPSQNMPWNIVMLAGILMIVSTSVIVVLKKRKI